MSVVRTVLGDLAPQSLGTTACHEHLIIDSRVVAADFPEIHLPSVEDAVAEMAVCAEAGLLTVVDAMPVAQGGDPARLAAVSRRTGIQVIASTGLHTAKYDVEPPPDDPDRLAAQFVADLSRSENPCGVVKISTGPEGVDDRARTLFTAAAEVAAALSAPVLTHCEAGANGVDQVRLLADLGVDPGRVALSHTDKIDDLGYHLELAAAGVYLEYDQGLRTPETTIGLIERMVHAGHADRLLLGTDAARRSLWTALGGGPGAAWLFTGLVPRLSRHGVDSGAVDMMLRTNPARWLTMDPR